MIITICGGGNAAHTLAGLLSSQEGLSVRVFLPFDDEADRWHQGMEQGGGVVVHTPTGERCGRPSMITSHAYEAIADSRLVILALPAFAHESILQAIAPYLEPGAWVGALPARGGFDIGARTALAANFAKISLFGLQTLPWACRIQHYGRQVVVLGVKDLVDIAAWPPDQAPVIAAQLEGLLGVRLNPIASFLALTLADTGQLIHPGIMYSLFHEWDGQPYPKQLLFYQSVDDAIAKSLQHMSNEVQHLRSRLEQRYPGLDLSAVRSLQEWLLRSYPTSIADTSTLQSKFATNRSYAGLLAPMRQVEGGFVPDFNARYLTEDVPFDLLVTRGIAELAGVDMPVIDRMLVWAQAQLKKEYLVAGRLEGADLSATRAPQRYAITSLDQLMSISNNLEYIIGEKKNEN